MSNFAQTPLRDACILVVMENDLQKAREIAHKHSPFVSGDAMLENIAKAVADGIATGREERPLAKDWGFIKRSAPIGL